MAFLNLKNINPRYITCDWFKVRNISCILGHNWHCRSFDALVLLR